MAFGLVRNTQLEKKDIVDQLNFHEMMDQFFKGVSLTGANGIIGRAGIIKSGADDLTSQPAGAAGRRLACGVIGIAKPR